jgi:hypothetical protein
VYQVTDLVSGKVYIGRHATYCLQDDYLGSGRLIQQAVIKHGRNNFRKKILFVFATAKESHDKERELVTESFCQQDTTYNMIPGGQGSFNHINRILTRADRQKLGRKGGPLAAAETMRKRTGLFGMSRSKLLESCAAGGRALRGLSKSETMKAKHREYIWITDGVRSRKLKYWEAIPVGFYQGRTLGAYYSNK